jgi:hypothetical protein
MGVTLSQPSPFSRLGATTVGFKNSWNRFFSSCACAEVFGGVYIPKGRNPVKTATEKVFEYVTNPKQVGRDCVDLKDYGGDLVFDRGAREITVREVKKTVSRTWDDTKENWGNLL